MLDGSPVEFNVRCHAREVGGLRAEALWGGVGVPPNGVGSGTVVPLDGDRLARWARAGAARLGGVPVTRWERVRSARFVGRGSHSNGHPEKFLIT